MTEAIPTTEKLAKALEEAKAPQEMIDRARAGYYDDFKSELTFPCIQLVSDLREAGLIDLANRATEGGFDSSPQESEAWFETEGKHHLPESMWGLFQDEPTTNKRPKPKGFGGDRS